MKKSGLIIIILMLQVLFAHTQENIVSLRRDLANATTDSARYKACKVLYDYYEETNRDSAYIFAGEALLLARKNNKKLAVVHCLDNMAYQLVGLGRYAESLEYLLEAFQILEDRSIKNERSWILFSYEFLGNNRLLMQCYTHHIFGILMWQTDNNDQAIVHFREARKIALEIHHTRRVMMANMNLSRSYAYINQLDSAMVCAREAEKLAIETGFKKYLGQVYYFIGAIYQKQNEKIQERNYYHKAIETSKEENNLNNLSASYYNLTKFYLAEGEKDSALYYSMKNLEVIKQLGSVTGITVNLGTVYENVYLSYKLGGDTDSLFKYQGLTLFVKDSFYRNRIKSLTEFQNVSLAEQLRLKGLEKEKVAYQNRVRTSLLLGGIGILLLLAAIFYRNNRQKHKAKLKIEQAYENLKATQRQLVHSEKMASLGELTAGIAHEIQNPLNFVNNFSEVNIELIEELAAEKGKPVSERNEKVEEELLSDISQNLQKISFHGKRADGIVKGMLQHSRTSTGQKELTDINELADEYLRLAYHGLRAKDKTFNAKFDSQLDPSIGKISIIPQDIGRVILNLINNAFYSVTEKRNRLNGEYEPTVTVTTSKKYDKVEITVEDNGNGIPLVVLDKIFQPFFTTKPAGQGTGLGLSLSYDIIKNHGGNLEVKTKEGEYTKFTITLPS